MKALRVSEADAIDSLQEIAGVGEGRKRLSLPLWPHNNQMTKAQILLLLLEAGGQGAGALEVTAIDLHTARYYAEQEEIKNGRSLDKEIPNFDKNFLYTQSLARRGSTQRREMPVIESSDVKELQRRLEKGSIDLTSPWSHRSGSNPFPEGLSGEMAGDWLHNGLAIHDGSENDDKVRCSKSSVRCGDLTPIQRQIYFDKSMGSTAQSGVSSTKSFLQNSTFIISADRCIIDGHHRWLSAVLIDPSMSVTGFIIDLPLNKLLPLTLAYGDAIGNSRNG